MSVSKEYLTAQTIVELLNEKNSRVVFDLFDKLYSIISTKDLKGIEIYIFLEELLNGKIYSGDEIMKILDKTFLQYSYYETDKLCREMDVSRYECWNRFAAVLHCIQPVFFHYVNEKEFFGEWNCCAREWIRPF